MLDGEYFYNSGFGWICRQCERDEQKRDRGSPSRIFTEGEAEESSLETKALASWTDKTRRVLACPRCGITELIDKA